MFKSLLLTLLISTTACAGENPGYKRETPYPVTDSVTCYFKNDSRDFVAKCRMTKFNVLFCISPDDFMLCSHQNGRVAEMIYTGPKEYRCVKPEEENSLFTWCGMIPK